MDQCTDHTYMMLPPGVWNIVTSVQEGFANVPKLYGSNVREPGKITDFSSGVKEAGKVCCCPQCIPEYS